MEQLVQYQANLLGSISNNFTRYAYNKLPWNSRFLGIKGFRGVGKTTMLLQYLKYELADYTKHLYVTLDHPYFYQQSLYDLATQFYQLGGQTLLVDEVHKLPDWSRQLKIIYDGYPNLQLIFTSSSALDILKGESDLSRRVLTYELSGLSFREYLSLVHGVYFPTYTLSEIINHHTTIAAEIVAKIKPLALFKDYLQRGYYPYSQSEPSELFQKRLLQALGVVLQSDINYIYGYTTENTAKIKKLLGVISESPPFTINIAAVANKLSIGRNTVSNYLYALQRAGILRFLNRQGKGVATLQKPDKIYLDNTNLSLVLRASLDKGTQRETFALNQLQNGGYTTFLPDKGDFFVEEEAVTLEVGGKNKTMKQLQNTPNGYVIADDIEIGFATKIPLYLLGFLY
ncbi:MAG: AAA family ATPase [Bacteroidota bacterium]